MHIRAPRPLQEALLGRWRTFARIHPIRVAHVEREFFAEGGFTSRGWIEEDDEDGRINEHVVQGRYEFSGDNIIQLRANQGAVLRLRLAIELDRYLTVTELDNGNVTRVYERIA